MNAAFWRGKKVLLTGHTGFKGAWLALWLNELGAKVAGYALDAPTEPSLFSAARVADTVEHTIADVRDLALLRARVRTFRPEIVFHLAAQALVRQSYAEPVETYATNVMGTANVLEAVRLEPSARAVVIVTSDKCYENREWIWGYRENEAMGGHDPYSSSKGCAELVCAAYRASYFNPGRLAEHGVGIASARAGNVIGGGDWSADRLIPDAYRAIASGEPVRIRNPKALRPWQHVLEPLSGYLLLAERLCDGEERFAQGWNFGPPEADARSVADVMNKVVELWGGALRWELDGGAHPHEATLLRLDCSKARVSLGWRPKLGLQEALAWTVEWYRAYLSKADVRQMTLDQISRYMSKEAS